MKKYVKIQGHNMQKAVKINIPGFSTQNSKAKTYQKNDLLPPLLRDPLRDGLVRFTEGILHQRPSVKWKVLSSPNSKFKLETQTFYLYFDGNEAQITR